VFSTADDTWNTVLGIIDRLRLPAPGVKKVEDGKTQVKPLLLY